jgi:hypothetical protein
MASRALAVPDPNAAWPGRFSPLRAWHMWDCWSGGRSVQIASLPWTASMQDETAGDGRVTNSGVAA